MHAVVIGSFSGANAGDSLILAATLKLLDAAHRPARYTIPTSNPSFVERFLTDDRVHPLDIHPRRTFSYRFVNAQLMRAVRQADVIVTTAGIYFDHRLLDPRFNFILSLWPLLQRARRSRTVVFAANVGITAPTSRVGAHVIGNALACHDHVAVRDSDSARLARALAAQVPVTVHADSAHALLARAGNRAAAVSGARRKVGLSLTAYMDSYATPDAERRGRDRRDLTATISTNLRELLALFDLEPIFVATTAMDYEVHAAVAQQLGRPAQHVRIYELTIPELIRTFDGLDYFIGSRLHSCIAATARGIPTIGAAYHPKVSSFMQEIGCAEWTLSVPALGEPVLHEAFARLMEHERDVSEHLLKANAERVAAAQATFDLLRPDGTIWSAHRH
jgi:polysaccharide pyruvyl transferase WcaK-like protein